MVNTEKYELGPGSLAVTEMRHTLGETEALRVDGKDPEVMCLRICFLVHTAVRL